MDKLFLRNFEMLHKLNNYKIYLNAPYIYTHLFGYTCFYCVMNWSNQKNTSEIVGVLAMSLFLATFCGLTQDNRAWTFCPQTEINQVDPNYLSFYRRRL